MLERLDGRIAEGGLEVESDWKTVFEYFFR
jgi:hypothetical protein